MCVCVWGGGGGLEVKAVRKSNEKCSLHEVVCVGVVVGW